MFPHTLKKSFILSVLTGCACLLLACINLAHAEQPKNFAGWYRTRLERHPESNCESFAYPNSEIVLFLQIRQDKDLAYADFCPSAAVVMSGHVKQDRLEVKSSATFGTLGQSISVSANKCTDKKFTEDRTVSVRPSSDNADTFIFEYSITRTCITASAGAPCTEKFKGIGFFETHIVWPSLDSDPKKMGSACNTAMQGCQTCHAEYKNMIPDRK